MVPAPGQVTHKTMSPLLLRMGPSQAIGSAARCRLALMGNGLDFAGGRVPEVDALGAKICTLISGVDAVLAVT